jgi:nucleoside-diphosphate-sugar epimerase
MAAKGLVSRLIHFSTFHVYGPPAREFYAEVDEPRPQHPYGQNHLLCERTLQQIAFDPLFILRPTNIVAAPAHADLGPQAKLIFLSLCQQVVRTGSICLDNDGLSYRDFVAFDDMLAAVRLLLSCPAVPFPMLNLSAASASRLDALAEGIGRVAADTTGVDPEIVFGAGKDAWRRPFVVCNKGMRDLGWKPRLDLAREIGKTLHFFAKAS